MSSTNDTTTGVTYVAPALTWPASKASLLMQLIVTTLDLELRDAHHPVRDCANAETECLRSKSTLSIIFWDSSVPVRVWIRIRS